MAVCKKTAEGFDLLDGESIEDYFKRIDWLMKKLEDRSKNIPDDVIVGRLLSFPVADGYAYYLVVSEVPLELEFVPAWDDWQIPEPYIRGLNIEDVRERVAHDRAIYDICSVDTIKEEGG